MLSTIPHSAKLFEQNVSQKTNVVQETAEKFKLTPKKLAS